MERHFTAKSVNTAKPNRLLHKYRKNWRSARSIIAHNMVCIVLYIELYILHISSRPITTRAHALFNFGALIAFSCQNVCSEGIYLHVVFVCICMHTMHI